MTYKEQRDYDVNPMVLEHGGRKRTTVCRSCEHLQPHITGPNPIAWTCIKRDETYIGKHDKNDTACGLWEPRGESLKREYEVTCPRCHGVRLLDDWTLRNPRFLRGLSEVCHQCSMKEVWDNRPRFAPNSIFLHGCELKRASSGKRCKPYLHCPAYESCLDYVQRNTEWPGWKAEPIATKNSLSAH
jgi:hypothetical protein